MVHDGLEAGQTSGQEDASKGQGRVKVISHGQEMGSGIGTGDDDDIVTIVVLLVVVAILISRSRADLDLAVNLADLGCTDGQDLLLVDGSVGRDFKDFALDGVNPPDDGDVSGSARHVAQNTQHWRLRIELIEGGQNKVGWTVDVITWRRGRGIIYPIVVSVATQLEACCMCV